MGLQPWNSSTGKPLQRLMFSQGKTKDTPTINSLFSGLVPGVNTRLCGLAPFLGAPTHNGGSEALEAFERLRRRRAPTISISPSFALQTASSTASGEFNSTKDQPAPVRLLISKRPGPNRPWLFSPR